mgnify:CR=1 FL=1
MGFDKHAKLLSSTLVEPGGTLGADLKGFANWVQLTVFTGSSPQATHSWMHCFRWKTVYLLFYFMAVSSSIFIIHKSTPKFVHSGWFNNIYLETAQTAPSYKIYLNIPRCPDLQMMSNSLVTDWILQTIQPKYPCVFLSLFYFSFSSLCFNSFILFLLIYYFVHFIISTPVS